MTIIDDERLEAETRMPVTMARGRLDAGTWAGIWAAAALIFLAWARVGFKSLR